MSDDGGDSGGVDSGGYSNDYSCDYSSNNHSSSAHTDNHHHSSNDYAGIGSTVSALNSAIGAVSSVESTSSAFHHHDTSHANNHHSSTRLQIDDVPSYDKYSGASESILNNYPTDNISSAGKRRTYRSYIRDNSSLNTQETYYSPPRISTGNNWSDMSILKKVIIIVVTTASFIACLYVLFWCGISGCTTKSVSRKQEKFITSRPLPHIYDSNFNKPSSE